MKIGTFCLVASSLCISLVGCTSVDKRTVNFNPIQNAKGPVVHKLMVERDLEAGHVLKADDLYELDYPAQASNSDDLPVVCKDALVGCKLVQDTYACGQLAVEDVSQSDLKRIVGKQKNGKGAAKTVCKHRKAFPHGYPCIDTGIGDTKGLLYLVNRNVQEGQEFAPDDLRAVAVPGSEIPQDAAEIKGFIVGKVARYGVTARSWLSSLFGSGENDGLVSYHDLKSSGKCFVATRDVKASEKLKESDFKIGPNLHADGGKKSLFSAVSHSSLITGKVARRNLAKGEIIHVLDVGD